MAKHYDVLGLGSVAVDYIAVGERWPEEGGKVPLEGFSVHDGGLIATALVAASRLGGQVCFVGELGYSPESERAISELKREGVDTHYVHRRDGAEPIVSFIFNRSGSGERTIFFSRQGVIYPYPDAYGDPEWYHHTKVLLIDHESGEAGIEAAHIAREYDVKVVIDVEQPGGSVPSILDHATDIVVSESFAQVYTGQHDIKEMLHRLCIHDDQRVIITRGRRGCCGLADGDHFEWPGYAVEVVDTTGCGDVFHGAYALSIAQGLSARESARIANAAAALNATQMGGRSGIPTRNQLETFMKKQTGI